MSRAIYTAVIHVEPLLVSLSESHMRNNSFADACFMRFSIRRSARTIGNKFSRDSFMRHSPDDDNDDNDDDKNTINPCEGI